MKSLWKVKSFEMQTSWKVMRFSRENEQKVTPTCTLTTWSLQRAAPHTPHSTATQHSTAQQHSNTAQHSRLPAFVLNFSPLWHAEHCTGNRIAMDRPAVSSRLFSTTLTFRTPQENHIVSVPFETIEKTKMFFLDFLNLPDTTEQFKT